MNNQYLIRCNKCGSNTSRAYARKHQGQCKQCADPGAVVRHSPTRNERIIDSGWQAYAREEGHYDIPDSY